jgi:hypothetical protein
MYIPVFEIKDSFIVKHKLQYNTDCNESLPYKMMFIDYDLARKSQTQNAENFSGITMDINLSGITAIQMNYFDESYDIYLDGDLIHEDVFSGTTVNNGTFYQQYYVDDGSLFFGDNERVDIDIYQKVSESGTTFWDHYAYVAPDVWTKSGATDNGFQWIVSGSTLTTGYTSGYTNWEVEEITPILRYTVDVTATGSTYIRVDKEIEDYLYNNFIRNYENLYYKITSLSHCNPNYSDIYLKIIRFPRADSFDINLNGDSIILEPVYNVEDIYFNYDALDITFSGATLSGSTGYTFETCNVYNQYDLRKFLAQLDIGENAIINETYSTSTVIMTGYTFGDYYMTLQIPETEDLIEYTYVKLEASGYTFNAIITEIINDNTFTVISPLNYQSGLIVDKVTTIYTVGDISDVLQKTYENYEQDEYRKHTIQIQKKIYNAYAEIINQREDNQELRLLITGLIFENDKKIMVLKVFDPADFIDDRLLYEPVEIVRIGKDRKTSIPVTIKEFTKGIAADVIDENIYSVYLFDPRIYDVLVIDANAT